MFSYWACYSADHIVIMSRIFSWDFAFRVCVCKEFHRIPRQLPRCFYNTLTLWIQNVACILEFMLHQLTFDVAGFWFCLQKNPIILNIFLKLFCTIFYAFMESGGHWPGQHLYPLSNCLQTEWFASPFQREVKSHSHCNLTYTGLGKDDRFLSLKDILSRLCANVWPMKREN